MDRRTALTAAAWAAPTIALSTAAPAMAASVCVEPPGQDRGKTGTGHGAAPVCPPGHQAVPSKWDPKTKTYKLDR